MCNGSKSSTMNNGEYYKGVKYTWWTLAIEIVEFVLAGSVVETGVPLTIIYIYNAISSWKYDTGCMI